METRGQKYGNEEEESFSIEYEDFEQPDDLVSLPSQNQKNSIAQKRLRQFATNSEETIQTENILNSHRNKLAQNLKESHYSQTISEDESLGEKIGKLSP